MTATTPFARADAEQLRMDAPAVVRRLVGDVDEVYAPRGWRLPATIERVYDNARARRDLGWAPRHDFARALACPRRGEDPRSPLARTVGAKGYHAVPTGAGHDGLSPRPAA